MYNMLFSKQVLITLRYGTRHANFCKECSSPLKQAIEKLILKIVVREKGPTKIENSALRENYY